MTDIGVYCIENIITGLFYIGSTNKLHRRRLEHYSRLKKGSHHSLPMQRDFKKYGEKKFVFYVIEYCTIEKLEKKEAYHIKIRKPHYNTFHIKHKQNDNRKNIGRG